MLFAEKRTKGTHRAGLAEHRRIAEATLKKDARINIRLSSQDLRALLARALKEVPLPDFGIECAPEVRGWSAGGGSHQQVAPADPKHAPLSVHPSGRPRPHSASTWIRGHRRPKASSLEHRLASADPPRPPVDPSPHPAGEFGRCPGGCTHASDPRLTGRGWPKGRQRAGPAGTGHPGVGGIGNRSLTPYRVSEDALQVLRVMTTGATGQAVASGQSVVSGHRAQQGGAPERMSAKRGAVRGIMQFVQWSKKWGNPHH